jgi:hypothetical protein
MSEGDVSYGLYQWIQAANTLVVDFDQGPRDGERWSVRMRQVDAYQPTGPHKFEGQGALEQVQDYFYNKLPDVKVTELGVDQWGRLVGEIVRQDYPLNLGDQLLADGYGTSSLESRSGDTVTLHWDDRRYGRGQPYDLHVDTTRP